MHRRLEKTNKLISVIGSCGRNFFSDNNTICYLYMDGRKRIWFYDSYSRKNIYTHYSGRWRHFTHGGTMRRLIESLINYIRTGQKISYNHFWFPAWYCEDVWGYGADMEIVRTAAQRLELI